MLADQNAIRSWVEVVAFAIFMSPVVLIIVFVFIYEMVKLKHMDNQEEENNEES